MKKSGVFFFAVVCFSFNVFAQQKACISALESSPPQAERLLGLQPLYVNPSLQYKDWIYAYLMMVDSFQQEDLSYKSFKRRKKRTEGLGGELDRVLESFYYELEYRPSRLFQTLLQIALDKDDDYTPQEIRQQALNIFLTEYHGSVPIAEVLKKQVFARFLQQTNDVFAKIEKSSDFAFNDYALWGTIASMVEENPDSSSQFYQSMQAMINKIGFRSALNPKENKRYFNVLAHLMQMIAQDGTPAVWVKAFPQLITEMPKSFPNKIDLANNMYLFIEGVMISPKGSSLYPFKAQVRFIDTMVTLAKTSADLLNENKKSLPPQKKRQLEANFRQWGEYFSSRSH